MRGSRIRSWFHGIGRRSRLEREMDAEVRFHLDSRAADLERSGVSAEQARRRARLEFGSVEAKKEEVRQSLGLRLWDELRGDVRYTLRNLRRSPGFAAVAILTLALGIGANTTVFTVVNGVLLRPLPFQEPERLFLVSYMPTDFPFKITPALVDGDYLQFRAADKVFETTAGFTGIKQNLTGAGDPVALPVARVEPEFLTVLRVAPVLGRAFLPEDVSASAPPVALLSDRLWRERFGADRQIVGKRVRLDGGETTIVGVMPPAFNFPFDSDLWVPFRVKTQPGASMFVIIAGRLKPAATVAQAEAELATLVRSFPKARKNWMPAIVPLKELLVGDVRAMLRVFVFAVALVLLIACANVANLLLARATRRQLEIAVRAALGATRARLIRQLLVESLVVAIAGGTLGVLLAVWGVAGLMKLAPADRIPRPEMVHADAWVLGYAIGVSLLTGILFGLAPALQATRRELRDSLSRAGVTVASSRERLRNALVVGEIALSLVLLAGTGLLLRSFLRLRAVDPGFRAENALMMSVDLPPATYGTREQISAFHDAILARLRALPGVVSAGAINFRPLSGAFTLGDFRLEDGRAVPRGYQVDKPCVTPGYFGAMGIAMLRGRDFSEQDATGGPGVVVISESVARQFWPNEDPVGRRITSEDHPKPEDWLTIVGVVSDVRQRGLATSGDPAIYQPMSQVLRAGWLRHLNFVVRTHGDPSALAPSLRATLAKVDKDQPLKAIEPMQGLVSSSIAEQAFQARLLSGFAALALLLAGIGIYGVLAYAVAQRTREIGIRMALGARRSDVVGMVLRRTLLLVGAGIALGTAGALAITRSLTSFLFGVKPGDPITFALVAMTMAAVALLAGLAPARRAARVDPMVALRYE